MTLALDAPEAGREGLGDFLEYPELLLRFSTVKPSLNVAPVFKRQGRGFCGLYPEMHKY